MNSSILIEESQFTRFIVVDGQEKHIGALLEKKRQKMAPPLLPGNIYLNTLNAC